MKIWQKITIYMTLFSLSGCQFDLSPWETDVKCPGRSVDENLEQLALLEAGSSPQDTFKVAVIGDPQQYPGDLELVIKRINKMDDVDFVLLLGDVAETGIEKEFEWSCKALSHTTKPIMAVVGNHDALAYGSVIWQNIFGGFDYSFSYKGTKFVAYNDNKYEFNDVPDKAWLQEEAFVGDEEVRNHTIGMSHIEPWDNEPELSGFLKQTGFDYMFHAHNHKFSFWQEQGVFLPHYITADTRDEKFGIATITPTSITMENCDPECIPAVLTTRNK